MSLPVSSLTQLTPATLAGARPAPAGPRTADFGNALAGAIQAVENPGKAAGESIQKLLSGDGEELHTVALAVQRAELAFDLGLQVRNKVVSAYQEIMRMQL
jgi:flagellar hook-basal body complex protein FliE